MQEYKLHKVGRIVSAYISQKDKDRAYENLVKQVVEDQDGSLLALFENAEGAGQIAMIFQNSFVLVKFGAFKHIARKWSSNEIELEVEHFTFPISLFKRTTRINIIEKSIMSDRKLHFTLGSVMYYRGSRIVTTIKEATEIFPIYAENLRKVFGEHAKEKCLMYSITTYEYLENGNFKMPKHTNAWTYETLALFDEKLYIINDKIHEINRKDVTGISTTVKKEWGFIMNKYIKLDVGGKSYYFSGYAKAQRAPMTESLVISLDEWLKD